MSEQPSSEELSDGQEGTEVAEQGRDGREPSPVGGDDGGAEVGPEAAAQKDVADGDGLDEGLGRGDRRWRDKFRDAEQGRRAAEARADRLATREALRLLSGRVADAQVALAISGQQVADLLNDDGEPDEVAVADLAERVLAEHPTLRQPGHHMDLGPKATVRQGRSTSWSGLLGGR